jgi:medium-chain acyl-[acyl-carrier-protein] hydrolase
MPTPWLRRFAAPLDPRARLFCLPYAGAGASLFRDWRPAPDTEVWAVQLPGREDRFSEPALTGLGSIVDELATAVAPLTDLPYAFFGHSMGALLSFELTRELRRRGLPAPRRLFMSAFGAADLPPRRERLARLPEAAMLARLREMAGSSSTLLDPEVLQVMLPMMRADFTACEEYVFAAEAPLDVPITAFCAVDDPEVDLSEMVEWWRHTTAGSAVHTFEGGHLYLREHAPRLLKIIAAEFSGEPAGPAPA